MAAPGYRQTGRGAPGIGPCPEYVRVGLPRNVRRPGVVAP